MKKIICIFILCFRLFHLFAQEVVRDQAIENQSQRMVYAQWNQNDFYPKSGFLDTNPYYWLVWGLFDPNYHNTDLRPLSATGPQTQRLALVSSMNGIDNHYKINSDTLRNTALSQIASQSGLLSDSDPLWLLYYAQQFQPLLNYSAASILGPLSPRVNAALVSGGLYSWYTSALDRLKDRLNGARSADMDRGSRIMTYFRMLKEYQDLASVWAVRVAAAQSTLNMTATQKSLQGSSAPISSWTPNTDVQIANKVLLNAQY
jgi:hypothetical protein